MFSSLIHIILYILSIYLLLFYTFYHNRYSAPASAAQQRAIVRAQRRAGVTSEQVSYVECHATATHVGDAIEMRGLADAFAENSQDLESTSSTIECALGSVKGNIGHANCAAGITGFIKTVLCLYHKTLVPTVHYQQLNDKIHFDKTRFYVNDTTKEWTVNGRSHKEENSEAPEEGDPVSSFNLRVAGVSSFGVGGTNAHVVLQEAPAFVDEDEDKAMVLTSSTVAAPLEEIILLSAKTIKSLKANIRRIADHVEKKLVANENQNTSALSALLPDVALTLSTGREHLQYRYSTVGHTSKSLVATLRTDVMNKAIFQNMSKIADRGIAAGGGEVVFVFPGQGCQYLNMSDQLYHNELCYHKHMDACAAVVDRIYARRGILSSSNSSSANILSILFGDDNLTFLRPTFVQPCIFMVEYCMARTLMDYGIVPLAMGGHSIGEYVAATLAGVFRIEDALELIVLRGIATEESSREGSMVSISNMNETMLNMVLQEHPGVTIATHNAPGMYVLSGTPDDVQKLQHQFTTTPVTTASAKPTKPPRIVLLRVNRAFHSPLMDEAATKLETFLKNVEMRAPSIPVTSNVSGGWMGDECCDPKYWGDHMRGTVRFVENAKCLAQWKPSAVVEVGPGSTLCKLLTKCWGAGESGGGQTPTLTSSTLSMPPLMPSMRHPKATDVADTQVFHATLGKLWCKGVSADWQSFHKNRRLKIDGKTSMRAPRKIALPGYSFAETSYWCNANASIYVADDGSAVTGDASPTLVVTSSEKCLVVLSGGTFKDVKKIIICFTYAGGTSRTFLPWKNEITRRGMDRAVQIVAVELCGRGARSEENVTANKSEDEEEISCIVDGLERHLRRAQRGTSVVVCGMSMGALYATRIAGRMQVPHGISVVGVVLAGRCPPMFEHQQHTKNLEARPFTEEDVSQYNLAPREITSSSAWRDHFLPLLLSDLAVDQRLSISSLEQCIPKHMNVHIVCGQQDPSFPHERAMEWGKVGGQSMSITLLPGGHEFLNERVREMVGICLSDEKCEHTYESSSEKHRAVLSPSPVFRVEWMPSGMWYENDQVSSSVTNVTDITLNGKKMRKATTMNTTMVLRVLSCSKEITADPAACAAYHVDQAWLFTQWVQSLINAMEEEREDKIDRVHCIIVSDSSMNSVFGISRSVTLEHPELTFQRMVLSLEGHDDDDDDDNDATNNDENSDSGDNDDVDNEAHRGASNIPIELAVSLSKRYSNEPDVEFNLNTRVVRLRRAIPSSTMPATIHVDKRVLHGDGIYVITGGTGGIGTELVRWLIDVQGIAPQNIVLLTRRSGPHTHPMGCRMLTLDVSKPTAWTDAQLVSLSNITTRSTLPVPATPATNQRKRKRRRVLGIFHLAGVLDDGTLQNMTQDRVAKVMAPKVHGILQLLALSKQWRWKTQYAVVFSSTTSLLGYPGQTNYAAANSVLDGLSSSSSSSSKCSADVHAATCGVPIVCCNWGPWGEVGMARLGSKPYNQALRGGELPMLTSDALTSLEHILREFSSGSSTSRQVGICRVEWSRSEWSETPMVSMLCDEKVPQPPSSNKVRRSSGINDDPDADADVDADDAPKDDVEIFFASRVSSWIPSESLTALGVDSLDEVQLRNDFQSTFSVKVPLSMFVVPNQTLASLCMKLKDHLTSKK